MRASVTALLLLGAPAIAVGSQGQGDPRLDYVLQCEGCHLADGSGAPSVGVPRLTGFVGRFLQVEGGREYLLQVPGVAHAPLSDAEIAALLNWMLVQFSPDELPHPFVPFDEAEVAAHRRTRIDPIQRRGELLEALAARGIATD